MQHASVVGTPDSHVKLVCDRQLLLLALLLVLRGSRHCCYITGYCVNCCYCSCCCRFVAVAVAGGAVADAVAIGVVAN